MENKKICPRCGYVAESDFVFCAKCGAELPKPIYGQPAYQQPTDGVPNMYVAMPQPPYREVVDQNTVQHGDDTYCYNYDGNVIAYEKTVDGVPTAEVSDYIGKNRHRILTKFFRQSYGAKGGWNWMVFLFGMLGVPFVWFFYRKMKKQGTILLIISLALALATGLTYGGMVTSVGEDAIQYFETVADLNDEYGYYDKYDFDVPFVYPDNADSSYTTRADAALNDFLAKAEKDDTYLAMSLILQLLTYLKYALAITAAIFADRWYYKKAMSDLRELNRYSTPDCETVMAAGGTKTKSAVLSGILGALAIVFVTVMAIAPFALPLLDSIINTMLV